MRKMQDRLIREEGRTNYHQQIRVYGFSLCRIESGKRKSEKKKEKKKFVNRASSSNSHQ
jgi:hypothetical protein